MDFDLDELDNTELRDLMVRAENELCERHRATQGRFQTRAQAMQYGNDFVAILTLPDLITNRIGGTWIVLPSPDVRHCFSVFASYLFGNGRAETYRYDGPAQGGHRLSDR